jgi:hypothetical protein
MNMAFLTLVIAFFIIVVVVVVLIKFGILKKLLRRKKEELGTGLPPLTSTGNPSPITVETTTTENVKVKMDLVLTELDSLRTQYDTLNKRMQSMEDMVKEIHAIAKS